MLIELHCIMPNAKYSSVPQLLMIKLSMVQLIV